MGVISIGFVGFPQAGLLVRVQTTWVHAHVSQRDIGPIHSLLDDLPLERGGDRWLIKRRSTTSTRETNMKGGHTETKVNARRRFPAMLLGADIGSAADHEGRTIRYPKGG